MATKVALMCVASVLAEEPVSQNCDFSLCNTKFVVAASWSPFSGAFGQNREWMSQPTSWGMCVCVCMKKNIIKEVMRS